MLQTSYDQSIFAWDIRLDRTIRNPPNTLNQGLYGLLAANPSAFAACGDTVPLPKTPDIKDHGFVYTALGIELSLPTRPHKMQTYGVALDCTDESEDKKSRKVIFLQELEDEGNLARVDVAPQSIATVNSQFFETGDLVAVMQKMHVRHRIQTEPKDVFYGFLIQKPQFPDCPSFEMSKVLIFSRDGHVTRYSGEPIYTRMLDDSYGTVAIVTIPWSATRRTVLSLRSLHFGFDSEFRPFCALRRSRSASTSTQLKTISALYRSRSSLGHEETQEYQNTLEGLNESIRTVDTKSMKVESDFPIEAIPRSWDYISVKSTVFKYVLGFTPSRLETFPKDVIVKGHRHRKLLIHLLDHNMTVSFEIAAHDDHTLSKPCMIWKIGIVPYKSGIVEAVPKALKFDRLGAEKMREFLTILQWLWSWVVWILLYLHLHFMVRTARWVSIFFVPMLVGGILLLLLNRVIDVKTILPDETLSLDLVRGSLIGTVSETPKV